MSISEYLASARVRVEKACTPLDPPYPRYCFFFSVSDGRKRAVVTHSSGNKFNETWNNGEKNILALMEERKLKGNWVSIEWMDSVEIIDNKYFDNILSRTKRNYFRKGICFDRKFEYPLTEKEINGNAILYGGNKSNFCLLNKNNLDIYCISRFGKKLNYNLGEGLCIFSTSGIFLDQGTVHELSNTGLSRGLRKPGKLTPDTLYGLIDSGAEHLARQTGSDGRFVYGYFPCFDREIATSTSLRHCSSTYAMIEAWSVTHSIGLKAAIERALSYAIRTFVIFHPDANGKNIAMLEDLQDEIKLGGNAALILALTKYCEVTGSRKYLPLAEQLANGIRYMQNAETGRFVHVLNSTDLTVKEKYRTIYYEGEATLSLLRLYGLTKNSIWMEMAENAISNFIEDNYWRKHDHWISYCINEITKYNPEEKYYEFGVKNFQSYLGFISKRITTFPTLLELIMSSNEMIERLFSNEENLFLLEDINFDEFYGAMNDRALKLVNGYFWPELAMYYRTPNRIVNSFFIRHQAFRVRIDDVEHYLSGLIAYYHFIGTHGSAHPAAKSSGVNNPVCPLSPSVPGGEALHPGKAVSGA